MPSFAHGAVDLRYEIRGRGNPVIHVAGLASDNAFWLPVVDGQVRAIATFDSTRHLAAIPTRTLVLAGTADLPFPVATSAAFAKAIPHASFDAIEGAAHSFPVELPQEFTRRVLAFLKAPSPR